MEGPLSKWTNVMQGWQYRWFVLDENNGILSYYTSKEKMNRGQRRGCVRLRGAVIGIESEEDDSAFTITVDLKVFHFQARDSEERERWVRALEITIHRHSGYYKLRRRAHTRADSTTTVTAFERRIQEADKYLQLMIEQVKSIEENVAQAQSETDEHRENQMQPVVDSANAMLDTVKHTIVVLQLAKNQIVPIDGLPLMLESPPRSREHSGQRFRRHSKPKSHRMKNGSLDADDMSSVLEPGPSSPRQPSLLPVRSYSSSSGEDEEQFHEALEEFSDCEDEEVGDTDIETPSGSNSTHNPIVDPGSIFSEPHPECHDDGVDFDSLYEDADESDIGNVQQEHGSVIMHLLSQVSIGMDLTRVQLPTFILERRSLLEMFADFFAHPDLFVSITDEPTPEQRMIAVVKWYMSSFHAGRRSSVAKKPYNPIIGEKFICYWDLPDSEPRNEEESRIQNGPLTGAHPNQLTFIAEQVSHHPPVSAFYAEHPLKRVTCNAHIWTKSKFLGLSIGVHMVGQGCISLLDHGEEYIATFPSGYGRSILTTPWIEMGGKVKVSCEKTGYHAEIAFLTKPFYGGAPHCIMGHLYRPGQKSSFMSIKGHWNGTMTKKFGSKDKDAPDSVFLNVNDMQIHRKRCAPISDQGDFESRRMWRHVTAALHRNDINTATSAKHWLEQRQRHGHKHRAATGEKWITEDFEEVGEHWVYKNRLQNRQVL